MLRNIKKLIHELPALVRVLESSPMVLLTAISLFAISALVVVVFLFHGGGK